MRRPLPTFREVRDYLSGLGFAYRAGEIEGDPVHVYQRPGHPLPRFIFPDYSADKPIPGHSLQPVHYHLTWNEVIPDISFDDFLDQFAPAQAG